MITVDKKDLEAAIPDSNIVGLCEKNNFINFDKSNLAGLSSKTSGAVINKKQIDKMR